jgi:hypothetical protein
MKEYYMPAGGVRSTKKWVGCARGPPRPEREEKAEVPSTPGPLLPGVSGGSAGRLAALALDLLRTVKVLEHQGVGLEVGALADDQALDPEVLERLDPLVVTEVRLGEVQVLDLAALVVLDAGDMDVGLLEGRGAQLLGDLFEDPAEICVRVDAALA